MFKDIVDMVGKNVILLLGVIKDSLFGCLMGLF